MTLPFYPFYWGDYSAKTFALTIEQHGVFMLLLRHIYTEGTPVMHEQRYSIAKALLTHEQETVDFILGKYFVKRGHGWVNIKALDVMGKWEDKHQRRVIAAQKPRKQCLSNGEAMQQQWPNNHNHNQYKGKPSVLKEESKDQMAGTIPLDENSEAFKAWESYWLQTKGKRPSRTDIRIDGKLVRGWYFETEWPPNVLKRTA